MAIPSELWLPVCLLLFVPKLSNVLCVCVPCTKYIRGHVIPKENARIRDMAKSELAEPKGIFPMSSLDFEDFDLLKFSQSQCLDNMIHKN